MASKKTAKKATKKRSNQATRQRRIRRNVQERETYRGRKVEVVGTGATPAVEIDGKPVCVGRDPDTGRFHAGEAPFVPYETLLEVGRAIVDAREEVA